MGYAELVRGRRPGNTITCSSARSHVEKKEKERDTESTGSTYFPIPPTGRYTISPPLRGIFSALSKSHSRIDPSAPPESILFLTENNSVSLSVSNPFYLLPSWRRGDQILKLTISPQTYPQPNNSLLPSAPILILLWWSYSHGGYSFGGFPQ